MKKTVAATQISSPTSQGKAARWSSLVAFLLAATLLYLALRGINWAALWGILCHARIRYLGLTLLVVTAAYFVRSMRWRVLLPPENRVTVLTVFWATIAGYLGNSFLPARAGELIRSVMLGRRSGLGTSFILATAISERLLDAVTLVLVGFTAISTFSGIPSELRGALMLMGAFGLVGVIGLVLAPRFEAVWMKLLSKLPLPGGVVARMQAMLAKFLMGMRACQSPSRGLRFAALTAVAWLTDAFGISLVAKAIGLTLAIPQGLFVLSALGLASALPSTPGYLGVYQFVSVSVLPIFGYTKEQALAFIVLAQAMSYAVIVFWGLPMFLFARDAQRNGLAVDAHRDATGFECNSCSESEHNL